MSILPTSTPQIRTVPGGEPEIEEQSPSHDAPLPKGDRNENPRSIGLLALLAENYRTYDLDLFEPAFWAVAVHRFGIARMCVQSKFLWALLTIIYRLIFTAVHWLWGIQLSYNRKLGRQVRILRHGGMARRALHRRRCSHPAQHALRLAEYELT
jgi:hypothetical protein